MSLLNAYCNWLVCTVGDIQYLYCWWRSSRGSFIIAVSVLRSMRAQSNWELIHSTSIQTHAMLNLSITTKTLSLHHTLTFHNIHTYVCNVLELQPLISHRTFLSYVSSINKLQLQKDVFNKSDWRFKPTKGMCSTHPSWQTSGKGMCSTHLFAR